MPPWNLPQNDDCHPTCYSAACSNQERRNCGPGVPANPRPGVQGFGYLQGRGKTLPSGRRLRTADETAGGAKPARVLGPAYCAARPRWGTPATAERNHYRRDLPVPQPAPARCAAEGNPPGNRGGKNKADNQDVAHLERGLLDRRRVLYLGHEYA